MKCYQYENPFTARQQAAILRLYVHERVPSRETAKRLRLPAYLVVGFLRKRAVMGRQGSPPGTRGKLALADRQNLERELATTTDVVLARKYGLSRGRIGQIRQRLGSPSSRVIRHALAIQGQAKGREQERLAIELREQRRRAKRLLAVNRLSKRWKSGVLVVELAQEFGYTRDSMLTRIARLRKEFPEKFPIRLRLTIQSSQRCA